MELSTLYIKIAILTIFLIGDKVIQARKRNRNFIQCPRLELENGRVKMRLAGRLAKFACRKRYKLLGNSFTICSGGQWNFPKPVCATKGCPIPESTDILSAVSSQEGSLMTYHCLLPTRTASKTVYCNGKRWNSGPPDCNALGNTNSSGEDGREIEEEETNNIIENKEPLKTTSKPKKSTKTTLKTTTLSAMNTTTMKVATTTLLTTSLKPSILLTTLKTTTLKTTTLLPITTLGRTKFKPSTTKGIETSSSTSQTVTSTPGTTSTASTKSTSSKPSQHVTITAVRSTTGNVKNDGDFTFLPPEGEVFSRYPPSIGTPTDFNPTAVTFFKTSPGIPLEETAMQGNPLKGNPNNQDGSQDGRQRASSKSVHHAVSIGMVSGIIAAAICSLGVVIAVVCFLKHRRHVTPGYNRSTRDWEFVQPILVQLRNPAEPVNTSRC